MNFAFIQIDNFCLKHFNKENHFQSSSRRGFPILFPVETEISWSFPHFVNLSEWDTLPFFASWEFLWNISKMRGDKCRKIADDFR